MCLLGRPSLAPLFRRQPWERRHLSSSRTYGQLDPKSIADDLLRKFSDGQTFVREQLIDPNQLRLFGLTLDRHYLWKNSESLEEKQPPHGTPLPPGYHL